MKWLIPASIAAAAAVYFVRRAAIPQPDPGQPLTDDQSQEAGFFESLQVKAETIFNTDPAPVDTGSVDVPMGDYSGEFAPGFVPPESVDFSASPVAADPLANRRAFLDMIAYSEGTSGANGYRTMFGGGLAPGLDDHPRQVFTFTNRRGEVLKTSAAGRYQFLARTWDSLRAKLNLPDFGPESQDAAALELVRQRGALGDVDAGRFVQAVQKCAPIWASLPGAGYAQPERKIESLLAAYTQAGGTVSA